MEAVGQCGGGAETVFGGGGVAFCDQISVLGWARVVVEEEAGEWCVCGLWGWVGRGC